MPTFRVLKTAASHAGAYQDWYRYLRSQVELESVHEDYQPMWLELKLNVSVKMASDAVLEITDNPYDRGSDGGLQSFVEIFEKALWSLYGILQLDEINGKRLSLVVFVGNGDIAQEGELKLPNSLSQLNAYFEAKYLGPPVGNFYLDTISVVDRDPAVLAFKNALELFEKGGPNIFGPHKVLPQQPVAGIIDDGLAFLNRRFDQFDGARSRFSAIWLQSDPEVDAEVTHTNSQTIYRETKDSVLGVDRKIVDEAAMYASLHRKLVPEGVSPRIYSSLGSDSHGAFVADLAFGSDPDGVCSFLDDIDLLGVQLPRISVLKAGGRHLETHVLQAVRWIVFQAIANSIQSNGWRPLVINISLGGQAGAKDGTDFLALQIETQLMLYQKLAKLASGKTIVSRAILAFGNTQDNPQTAVLNSKMEDEGYVIWRVQPDDHTPSYLEIQTCAATEMPCLRITSPSGTAIDIDPPQKGSRINLHIEGQTIGRLYTELTSHSQRTRCVLALAPTANELATVPKAPSGAWRIELAASGEVALQVARDGLPGEGERTGRQSYLDHPSIAREMAGLGAPVVVNNLGNHSAWLLPVSVPVPSTQLSCWSVGASYVQVAGERNVWQYTSSGSDSSLQSHFKGPTLSTIGSESSGLPGLLASGTLSGSIRRAEGTSAAAAIVTRALLYQLVSNCNTLPGLEVQPEHQLQLGENWLNPDLTPGGARESHRYRC